MSDWSSGLCGCLKMLESASRRFSAHASLQGKLGKLLEKAASGTVSHPYYGCQES